MQGTNNIARTCQLLIFGLSIDAILQSDVFCQGPRDLHVLEVFSLSKTLVRAAEARELSAMSFDYMNPGQGDILSEAGFHQAIRLVMRVREAGLMCIAPDCSSFSWACSSKTKRTKQNFAGDTSNPTVRNGNFMAEVAFFLFCLAAARGVYVCLENPVGSTLFSFLKPHILALDSILHPQFFLVDRCAFVTERPTYGKRYKFMCLHPSHAVLSPCWFKKAVHSACTCIQEHLPLMDSSTGVDGKVKKTGNQELKASGLYPPALGESIVLAWLVRFAPDAKPSLLEREHPLPSTESHGSDAVHSPAVHGKPDDSPVRMSPDALFEVEDDPWGDCTTSVSGPSKEQVARSKAKVQKSTAMKAKPKAKSKAKTKKLCTMKAKKKPSAKKPSARSSGQALSLPNELSEEDPWAGS